MPSLATWNMQGSNAATEVKWQTGALNLMTEGAAVLCLQECGAPPASAVQQPGFLDGNPQYRLYHWGTARTRTYISHYHWDQAGNRVNLAIVSRFAPTAWLARTPGAGAAWRPVIGAQINGTWYFSLHAISPGGADAPGLLAAAAMNAGGAPWFVAGDFNRAPLPAIGIGNVCLPNGNTYPTVNPAACYDYMYSRYAPVSGTVLGSPILSDHLAVWYAIV